MTEDEIAAGVARGIQKAETERFILEAVAAQSPPPLDWSSVAITFGMLFLFALLLWWGN